MKDKVQKGELLGHIGSPSSTAKLKVNLDEGAYTRGLVGNFCVIPFVQDGDDTFSIGQIISSELSNPYLERHSVEKIVSIRGEASPLTEKHDVLNVTLGLGSTYSMESNGLMPSTAGTVPPTGTPVYLLNQDVVDEIAGTPEKKLVKLGKMYNTNVLLPMIFQHFGERGEGGLREGYHLGVFGKTGSGKSYLTRMILLSYASYPNMSVLCLDPMGEYARKEMDRGKMYEVLKSWGRSPLVLGVSEISLETTTSLKRIIMAAQEVFLDRMGVRAEANRENAARLISDFFEYNPKLSTPSGVVESLPNAHKRFVFNRLMDFIQDNVRRIYVSGDQQERVLSIVGDSQGRNRLYEIWQRIAGLFASGRAKLSQLLSDICRKREVVIVDLSEPSATGLYWNEKTRAIVIDEIVKSLVEAAEEAWRDRNESINTIVVMDEAHRLVSSGRSELEELEALKSTLVDCVKTTRKYGLGWMFVSQSLASLHPEVIRQMRIYFFGYGLSWGAERRTLKQIIGGERSYMDLYSSFRDPETSGIFGKKEYPFMVYGPVSPLSVAGNPIFFNVLDYFNEFSLVREASKKQ